MELEENLKFIAVEITLVENRNIDYFKSKSSLTSENNFLRLNDCVSFFKYFEVPPVGQRLPPPGNLSYQIGFVENSLPEEIEKELQIEINKKFK